MSVDGSDGVGDDATGDADTEPGGTGVPKWPVVGIVLALLWLLVRGVAPGETLESTLRTVLGEFLIGLAVGWPTAFALRRYYLPRVSVGRSLRVAPYAALYVVVFLRELLTANIDVAYRVLAPSMPIRPDVIAIPLRVESDAAVTTIANSITLTPGTLTMDHDATTNTLYVHAIAARDRDSIVSPIRTWEDYALVIFEGRDPNTEIPREPPGLSMTDPERSREEREGRADDGNEDGERVTGERTLQDGSNPDGTVRDDDRATDDAERSRSGGPSGDGGDDRGR